MASYLNCLVPLPFFAVGLWLFLTWPFWPGIFAFLAMFLLGSMLGTIMFKRVEMARKYDGELVETLKSEHGVTVTEPDVAAFREVLVPVQSGLIEEFGLKPVLDALNDQN